MCNFIMICGFWTFLFLACVLVKGIVTADSTETGTNSILDQALSRYNDRDKQKVIQTFESGLLKIFGLERRPKPSANIQIPQYMLDLFQQHNPESPSFHFANSKAGSANTVRSHMHIDHPDPVTSNDDSCAKMVFNISNIPEGEVLNAAELRVFLDKHISANNITRRKILRHKIEVHEIMQPGNANSEAITRLIDVKHVLAKNATWISLDIHPAVLKWRKTPKLNHGIEVRVSSKMSPSSSNYKHVRLRRSASLTDLEWHSQRPILVTYTDDKIESRTKRAASKSKKKNKRKRKKNKRKRKKNKKNKKKKKKFTNECSRKPLFVDFSAVGWNDWIVAPPGYNAFYCDGECHWPYGDHVNATNHAIVQDLVNSIDPRSVPKPCCVPTELKPITLLFIDDHEKVVLKAYQDMQVVGCGCR